jgi:hypothetical protein
MIVDRLHHARRSQQTIWSPDSADKMTGHVLDHGRRRVQVNEELSDADGFGLAVGALMSFPRELEMGAVCRRARE